MVILKFIKISYKFHNKISFEKIGTDFILIYINSYYIIIICICYILIYILVLNYYLANKINKIKINMFEN